MSAGLSFRCVKWGSVALRRVARAETGLPTLFLKLSAEGLVISREQVRFFGMEIFSHPQIGSVTVTVIVPVTVNSVTQIGQDVKGESRTKSLKLAYKGFPTILLRPSGCVTMILLASCPVSRLVAI